MSAWPFSRRAPKVGSDELWARWFRPVLPEGNVSLEAFERAMGPDERERLPKTLRKLALDGVARILEVRRHEVDPDRRGIEFLDALLDAGVRENLGRDQDPNDPRNLFRVAATEFGCIVGEIWVRAGKGTWSPARAPNLWRSVVRTPSGRDYDPFRAVVRQLSDDREAGRLVRDFDAG